MIKWKHFPRYWPFVRGIHRTPVNSLHKGQWRGALMFSLICAWINRWLNNREAGDLRRYRARYDVSVMLPVPNHNWIKCEQHGQFLAHSAKMISMTSKWARWRLKSPASRVFIQTFVQAQVKENIKLPRHWPLWGEFTGERWIPRTKGQ